MESTTKLCRNNLGKVWQIWLLDSINNSLNIAGILELARTSINNLKAFDNITECEQFIDLLPSDDRIVFIIHELLTKEILPKIHPHHKIFAIYVYSVQKETDNSWYKQFTKFRGIRSEMRELAGLSRRRQRRRVRRESDEVFSFDVSHDNAEQDNSTAELNGQFVHSQLIIDCLQNMKSTSKQIEEFIRYFREQKDMENNKRYLNHLDEFEKEYCSEESLRWYTKDSFVYRMLNKALRVQNIDMLFLFRFFIRDLAQQLKANQWLSPGSVYRGQTLSKCELNRLEKSIGKLVSINSFLSTTLYPDVACIYIGSAPGLEKALLKIDFDPTMTGIKPFADITLISEFPEEGEVLFMLGAIFQIQNVYSDDDGTWIIQLNLCGEHDQALESIFRFLRNESNRCELDLLAFGNVLHDMGESEQARCYYDRCLSLLPSNDHIWRSYCYYLLGLIATENGDDKWALDLFDRSLSMRKQVLQTSDPSIADTLTAIARVHYINNDFDLALDFYEKALIIFQQAFTDDDLTSAMGYTNLGVVCRVQHKYSQSLDYHQKAFTIRQKHLPPDHFRFGTSYNNMGEVYHDLGEYDTALKYYEMALDVYSKSLPSRHVDVAIVSVNKGDIYEKKGDLEEALALYKRAAGICRYVWSTKNPYLLQIEHLIGKAENTKETELDLPFRTIWIKVFRPFKCIASHDPRSGYREILQKKNLH